MFGPNIYIVLLITQQKKKQLFWKLLRKGEGWDLGKNGPSKSWEAEVTFPTNLSQKRGTGDPKNFTIPWKTVNKNSQNCKREILNSWNEQQVQPWKHGDNQEVWFLFCFSYLFGEFRPILRWYFLVCFRERICFLSQNPPPLIYENGTRSIWNIPNLDQLVRWATSLMSCCAVLDRFFFGNPKEEWFLLFQQ